MERKIGEKFTVRGTTLEVEENPECDGCFFYKGCQYYSDGFDEAGDCSMRRDKKSVIFKSVKKENANATAAADATAAANANEAQCSSLTAQGSLPLSTPVHMTEEEKQKALMALPHERIEAFSKLYANFIIDCDAVGIRVTGVEFYQEKEVKPLQQ